MNVLRRTVIAGTVLAASMALAPAAIASGGGGGTSVNGVCSGSSSSKLKVKPDNGRLEVEFEVDSNKVGQNWNVRLFDNGTRFFAGTRTTMAPSGSSRSAGSPPTGRAPTGSSQRPSTRQAVKSAAPP